jgi:NAD(P)-dependent dehydrogenase (short-subunit alcohol dehydrogenase family)
MTTPRLSNVPRGPLVVFGGASGIGLATATIASENCDEIIIADVDASAPELDLVRSGRAQFVTCDATDPNAVETALQFAQSHFGGLSSVVTTVGGSHFHDPLELDLAAWRREITFNLESAYVVATIAAKHLKALGGGSIVTTSSTIAAAPRIERIGYAAAKAGVIALTKGLALAVAADGVRVNCVAPHSTDTPRFRAMIGDAAALESRIQASPQKRIAVPDDLAHTILFLISDASRSTTGQTFWVNNGNYMP